jgi:hypothetical protein
MNNLLLTLLHLAVITARLCGPGWRASRDCRESRAQAATDRSARCSPVRAEPDAERPAPLRILVSLPSCLHGHSAPSEASFRHCRGPSHVDGARNAFRRFEQRGRSGEERLQQVIDWIVANHRGRIPARAVGTLALLAQQKASGYRVRCLRVDDRRAGSHGAPQHVRICDYVLRVRPCSLKTAAASVRRKQI